MTKSSEGTMTAKERVLEVYPYAFAVKSNGWLWSVYPDNASGCLNSADDSSETEDAAWQNAAESISTELRPVEIVGNHWIHRDGTDADAKFYRRDEVDAHHASIRELIEKTLCSIPGGMAYGLCLEEIKGRMGK